MTNENPNYANKSIRFQAAAEVRALSRELTLIEARQKGEPKKERSPVAKLLARIGIKL